MRKPILPLLVICLLLAQSGISQDLQLLPKWKKDDVRTLYFSDSRTLPRGEQGDTTVHDKSSAKVKIYSIDAEKVLITIDHENVMLKALRPYLDPVLPMEFDPYKRMVIRYDIDRATGRMTLMNAEDLRTFSERAWDISMRAIRKKDQKQAAFVDSSLKQMITDLKDPLRIEQFFEHRLGFITMAFGESMSQGQKIERSVVERDPYGSSGDSLVVTSTLLLESVDNTNAQASVNMKRLAEPKPIPPPTPSTLKRPPAAAKPPISKQGPEPPKVPEVKVKKWQEQETVLIDTKTTWPIRVSQTLVQEMSDGASVRQEMSVEVR
jgi:hypothetical protein